MYCPDFKMTVGTDCTKGHFCAGTNGDYPGSATLIQIKPTPCPAGTYGAPAKANGTNQCLACTDGNYCDTPGQLVTGGPCESGFICLKGNDRPGPYVTAYKKNPETSGKCDPGNFCEAGVTTQTPCPTKFYSLD